jgi:DNA-binding beta-propeller fold protein YncE
MRRQTFFGFFMIILMLILQGCAAQKQKETFLSWPEPPAEPRVVYVATYHGSVEFTDFTFWDKLFGAQVNIDIYQPFGIAAHQGKIYLADSGQKVLVKMDPQSRKVEKIGTGRKGKLIIPLGVAVAADGTIYVADGGLKLVNIYDPAGELKSALGTKGEFQNPSGVAVDDIRGHVIVVDSQMHAVSVFSREGERLFSFGERGGGDGMFNFPSFVTIDKKNGNIIVSDSQNFRVQIFSPEGKFLSKFGEPGDAPGTFARPRGIGIDSEGHIYVVDSAFDNFQIFDQTGQILLYVGSAGTETGKFQLPAGLFIDDSDRIYVADTLNRRVQVFQYLSEKWKKEHPEEYSKYVRPAQGAVPPSLGK